MEKRRLGRTAHTSTVMISGAAAFYEISQPEADQAIEFVRSHGINHFDVAPLYRKAQERLGRAQGLVEYIGITGHWYHAPAVHAAAIEQGIRFALSQPVTAFASPADVRLLPMAIQAVENLSPLSSEEQKVLVESSSAFQPLFPPDNPSGGRHP